jgi:hypothetical protein
MERKLILIAVITGVLSMSCSNRQTRQTIGAGAVTSVIKQLTDRHGEQNRPRIEKGVGQMAALWEEKDGSVSEFEDFCLNSFVGCPNEREQVFERLCKQFETIYGGFTKMSVSVMEPVHIIDYAPLPVDAMFASWSPSAHFRDDFFANKIAFYVMLNFPFYGLDEKNELGEKWSPLEWGYARMGDIFTSRVPAEISQNITKVDAAADHYIADYNIYMGRLVDENQKTFFPEDLKLISHWGLRDELKSQYANDDGLPRQRMIYEVMKRIIHQTIPVEMINRNEYTWNPYQNEIYQNGQKTAHTSEPSTRYGHLLAAFQAAKACDVYTPVYPTSISRKFDREFELSQAEVEQLFISLLESPQAKLAGELISRRLGRSLEPFDIWYDGFKPRSGISPDFLDQLTRTKYPDKDAFAEDMPNILVRLGFPHDKASFICRQIRVDASRGAGHAWGATMRGEQARLRTRIGENGMDYKGYNIGIHELGHNVEQVITLHDAPNYMLADVPNTAFTEALAFLFQKKDLELLGINDEDVHAKHLAALDLFWGCFEMMGVSLVDMRVWKWMYENPDLTKEQLKNKTIEIAKDVWNTYYYPVFGTKDEPVLAVYSHMIASPLYLSAYPLGRLIQFQIENYYEGKIIGIETLRLFSNGCLTPQQWMKKGLGTNLSVEPVLNAVSAAVEAL